jgi:hypothetical protein
LSPPLWNLVVDRLLTITNDLDFSTFGYADDIVIIVQGTFAHSGTLLHRQTLTLIPEACIFYEAEAYLRILRSVQETFCARIFVRLTKPSKLRQWFDPNRADVSAT